MSLTLRNKKFTTELFLELCLKQNIYIYIYILESKAKSRMKRKQDDDNHSIIF